MHSETTSSPAPKPVRPRGRRIAIAALALLIALLAILVVAAAGAAWLLGSESGARQAFALADRSSSGALRAEGVHGRLLGPLRVEKLSWETADRVLTLNELRLEWRPAALLRRQLHLTSLHIGRLEVVNKVQKKPEPAKLPDRLALPLQLQIDQAQIERGSIAWGPVNLVELGGLAFHLDFDGSRYRLGIDRLALRSTAGTNPAAGNLRGTLTLGAHKPYEVNGEFSSGGETTVGGRTISAGGSIKLAGSLAELRASLDLSANEIDRSGAAGTIATTRSLGQATGHALLRPFSVQPLGSADLEARAIDLASLSPGMPQTQLDVRLFAAHDGSGELIVANPAAGLINDNRLPLISLELGFHQSGGGFDFTRIAAALGTADRPAGNIGGSGRYAGGALTLALSTKALDAQRLDRRMRPTSLAGDLKIRHADGRQEFTVALSEPLKKNHLTLSAHAVLADTRISLDRAELRAGEGSLRASGEAELSGKQGFRAQGVVSRFSPQELGEFPQLPKMSLNAGFTLHGARAPVLEADLSFSITDSMLAGYPLRGDGRTQLHGDRISIPGLLLAVGDNRLTMQGELAERRSQLSFALNAPKLEQFGAPFGGSIEAAGNARGTLRDAQLRAEWKAAQLRLPGAWQIDASQGSADIGIARGKPFSLDTATVEATAQGLKSGARQAAALTAKIRFSPRPDAPLALDIQAQRAAFGDWRADRIALAAAGTTARHTLDASVIQAAQNWTVKASGGLSELARAPQWQGLVNRLDARGDFQARLVSAAPLFVSRQRVQLDDFRLDSDAGLITVEQFVRRQDRRGTATRGRVERLRIASLLKFTSPNPMLSTDLEIDGEWNITLADALMGNLRIARRQGDIVMRGGTPVALGLRTLQASATASGGRLALRLVADGSRLGRIDADASTSFTRTDETGRGGFALAQDAPLSGTARIDMPSIGWAGPLLSPALIAEGRVHSVLTMAGTVADPKLGGRIDGSGLRLLFTDTGVDLRDGTLESVFSGSELMIRSLRFQSANGQAMLSGPIAAVNGKPVARLALAMQRFTLLDRSDRRLTLSGSSKIAVDGDKAQVTGAFQVDSGFFDIGRQGTPHLSEDVVIVGRDKEAGKNRKLAAAVDITIALGEGVRLRGRGLDALMRGQLRLQSAAGETLQAQGTISVAKGTYTAYGRDLTIERGLLRFTGPLNNPTLDILAMRRKQGIDPSGQEVEAGVSVGGTALTPRITLVSEPNVPDTEKLSWLVLGHGTSTAGGTDLSVLQAAAATLLTESAASGAQSRIASTFGLDTLSVSKSQDTLQQRIVTLGKQVSSRLYVSYQQGLETAAGALLLRYTLSPRLTLEAEAGTRSVLSLFYNISFD